MLNLHICLLVTIPSITDLNMVWEITDSWIHSFPQRGSDQNRAIGFCHLFSYYYQAYRNCITLRWLSNKYASLYQFYQVDSISTLQMKELRLRKFKQFVWQDYMPKKCQSGFTYRYVWLQSSNSFQEFISSMLTIKSFEN